MDTEKAKVRINYKSMRNSILAGYVQSLVFLRDSLDKPHFEDTLHYMVILSEAISNWLMFVKQHMKIGDDLIKQSDIDKVILDKSFLRFREAVRKEKENKEVKKDG